MFLTELEDVIAILRTKLEDYLQLHKILEPGKKKFSCIVHDDSTPSMILNPKSDFTTAHCFGCNANIDIFAAASIIEMLPSSGSEWVTETLPSIAKQLGVDISLGEPSPTAKLKSKFYKLAEDISTILTHPKNEATAYIKERNWVNDFESCYSMDYKELFKALTELGHEREFINQSGLISVGANNTPLIGKNFVTSVFRDPRKRTVAFVSRNLGDSGPKYLHSSESPIFNKSEFLLGLDIASVPAKHNGLFIVEGIGERNQFLRAGQINIAAAIGTALTEKHLYLLKDLGIRNLYIALDWDDAGQTGITRIIKTIQEKKITGFNIAILDRPPSNPKDLDEYLIAFNDQELTDAIKKLKKLDIFTFFCKRTDLSSLEEINKKLIPIIASQPVAMIREKQIRELSGLTNITETSIMSDVERIRNQSFELQKERVLNSIDKYKANVEQDPSNASALISLHEREVQQIEQDYTKGSIGVNYQIQRFDALQAAKADTAANANEFCFSHYSYFADAFSGGLPWTEGALFYFGGRENAGKTATMLALATDVAFTDENAIVICHFTDDNYKKLEGRFLTNFAFLQSKKQKLSIFNANNPQKIDNPETSALYKTATLIMKNLIATERLVIIDAEDGTTLTSLEKVLRYIRHKYPSKKVLCVCDKNIVLLVGNY